MTTVDEWIHALTDPSIVDHAKYLDAYVGDNTLSPDDLATWWRISRDRNDALDSLRAQKFGNVPVSPSDEASFWRIIDEVNDLFFKTSGDLELHYKTYYDYMRSGDPVLQSWARLKLVETPAEKIQQGDFPELPGTIALPNGKLRSQYSLGLDNQIAILWKLTWDEARAITLLNELSATLRDGGPPPSNLVRAPMLPLPPLSPSDASIDRTWPSYPSDPSIDRTWNITSGGASNAPDPTKPFADGSTRADVAAVMAAAKNRGSGDEVALGLGGGGSVYAKLRGSGGGSGMSALAEGVQRFTPGGDSPMSALAERIRKPSGPGPGLGGGPSVVTVKGPAKAPGVGRGDLGRGGRGGTGGTPRGRTTAPASDSGSAKAAVDRPDRPDPRPSASTTAGPAPNPTEAKSVPTASPQPRADPALAPAAEPAPNPPADASTNTDTAGSGAGTTTTSPKDTGKSTGGTGDRPPSRAKPDAEPAKADRKPVPEKPQPRPPPKDDRPDPNDDSGGGGNPRSRGDNPDPESSSGGRNPRASSDSRYRPYDDGGGSGGTGGPRAYDFYPDPESSGSGGPRGRAEMPNPEDSGNPGGPRGRAGARTIATWNATRSRML